MSWNARWPTVACAVCTSFINSAVADVKLAAQVGEAVGAPGPAVPWEVEPPASRDAIVDKVPDAGALIDQAAWFRVRVSNRDGDEFDQPALALPLPERGYLVLFVDGSQRTSARLVGDPAFDNDPTARWRILATQMTERMGKATAASLPTPDERAKALEAAATDDQIERLHRLRRLMREGSARFSQTSFGDREVIVTEDWIESWADAYSEIEALAPTIEGLYSEDIAASFELAAQTGRERLLEALEAERAGDSRQRNQRLRGLYRASCQACHETMVPSGRTSSGLYSDLKDRLPSLGARGDLFQVGVDAVGFPGDDERSQQVLEVGRVAIALWNDVIED